MVYTYSANCPLNRLTVGYTFVTISMYLNRYKLAGSIGTGLFLGLGEILAFCGPLGSLIVYILVASVVYRCARIRFSLSVLHMI